MKKTLTAILAAAILALPMETNAGPIIPQTYGRIIGEVQLEDGRRIEALKGTENSEILKGAVRYEEWSPWENIGGTPNSFHIKSVIDYNDNGIFDEEDRYTIRNDGEGEGKNPVKGQKILNELKKYFYSV